MRELKRSTLSSSRGFTLSELLVSSAIGLSLIGMTISTVLSYRSLYEKDLARTEINENLRGGLDLMSQQIRQAGENLNSNFPAILLTNGSNAPDEIILRRNLLDEVAVLCANIAAGSSKNPLMAKKKKKNCPYRGMSTVYSAWSNYRTGNGGSVTAAMYDSSTKGIEFFPYVGENMDTVNKKMSFLRGAGTWSKPHSYKDASMYILESWKFRVSNGVLQLLINSDSPRNVITGVTDMQIVIYMKDGSTKTSFTTTDKWTDIQSIEVTLSGESTVGHSTVTSGTQGRWTPRNVLNG